jgi:hypothetical protein
LHFDDCRWWNKSVGGYFLTRNAERRLHCFNLEQRLVMSEAFRLHLSVDGGERHLALRQDSISSNDERQRCRQDHWAEHHGVE